MIKLNKRKLRKLIREMVNRQPPFHRWASDINESYELNVSADEVKKAFLTLIHDETWDPEIKDGFIEMLKDRNGEWVMSPDTDERWTIASTGYELGIPSFAPLMTPYDS